MPIWRCCCDLTLPLTAQRIPPPSVYVIWAALPPALLSVCGVRHAWAEVGWGYMVHNLARWIETSPETLGTLFRLSSKVIKHFCTAKETETLAIIFPLLLFLSLGSEEGGVSPGAIRPLQPHRPFPGASEGLWVRGPRRRQGTAAAGLQPHLCPGGCHGPLQKDARTHVSSAGCRREPPEEGKTQKRKGKT